MSWKLAATNRALICDLFLYRDANGNGVLDWGNEQVGSSGNFNCDESISYTGGQSGTYWAVVHGYDLRASNTTFWLRWTEIGGSDLGITDFVSLNHSEIQALYPNGSNALAGAIPETVLELNLTWNRPSSAGIWGGFVDLTLDSGGLIRLPYSFNLVDPAPELSFRFRMVPERISHLTFRCWHLIRVRVST